jgi:ribosomal protein S3
MLSKPIRDVAETIGQFYLQKNNGDYAATAQEIANLRIVKLDPTGDSVSITTGRPGILIGRRGITIIALSKFIHEKMQLKIKIIEDTDNLQDCLTPRRDDY